jgi:hypothetical protein
MPNNFHISDFFSGIEMHERRGGTADRDEFLFLFLFFLR